jgi:hypothetical protein
VSRDGLRVSREQSDPLTVRLRIDELLRSLSRTGIEEEIKSASAAWEGNQTHENWERLRALIESAREWSQSRSADW